MHSRHFWHASFQFAPAFGCGEGSRHWVEDAVRHARRFESRRFDDDELSGGTGLGVRRPLRFLAWKLDLDEAQIAKLARALERLKLERAQAALDLRRGAADLADVVEAEALSAEALSAAGERRVAAARRVEAAVAAAMAELHALLAPDQRTKLAELIRTGVIRV